LLPSSEQIDLELERKLRTNFNIQVLDFEEGMKYLGYYLKENNHRVSDWNWIIQKIEKRIGCWSVSMAIP
jgi:hypothetical protein